MIKIEKLKSMNSVKVLPFTERIECSKCGWYNNKPSKDNEHKAKCKHCGVLLIEKYRFIEKMKGKLKNV